MYLIDEPAPYGPVKKWKEHLRALRKLDQNAPEVKEAMERARQTIREIEDAEKKNDRS